MKKAKKTVKKAAKKQDAKLTLSIIQKNGDVLHTFPSLTKEQAKQTRRFFYRVLIQKMNQKVSFKLKAS